ncbi:MAG: hypothetical protein HYW07_00750 [Candidatus Latescibacteria bacterium]|nr:hypothetical protein [Candidatus Latescibacterota bacterium]
MSDPAPDPQKKIRLFEDIFIVLCILSLWPVILGWDEPVYEFALYVALAGLLVIFFRRVKRFQKAKRDLE